MSELSGTQKRRRNEGDDMKGGIRRWEETTLTKRGAEGQIKEKSVGALHR